MDYLDTSVLVTALTSEADTPRVQDWLTSRSTNSLAISDWVATEFSVALSIKLRTGDLDTKHRDRAWSTFTALAAESLTSLEIGRVHYRTAARFAAHHDTGLRAGDALHLAIAADHGATLYTLDRRLATAGAIVGVDSRLV